ncbi:hypothetical protein M422DRAFT_260286 [Sphaerobolus stellatus SS14]|uniref:Unplaced genomic scaffold SPHSTscaffold_95, whole genome shotgun sequence n=1 Tax=Sphaerobolus stellatus (strain SS14) TaxID=990650 RepID=A0A0C9V718_SPHS4|nr:hypothetical protein M422DRAFT_260286 [Sphaerobolus stellatus SS14]
MDNEHNAPMQVDPSTHPVSAIQAFKLDPSMEWVIESTPGFVAIKHKMGCPICDASASHCMAMKRSYEICLDEKEVTDTVAEAWPELVRYRDDYYRLLEDHNVLKEKAHSAETKLRNNLEDQVRSLEAELQATKGKSDDLPNHEELTLENKHLQQELDYYVGRAQYALWGKDADWAICNGYCLSDIPVSDGEDDDEDQHGLPTLPEEIPQDVPSWPPTRIARPTSKPHRKDAKVVPEAGIPAIGSSRFPTPTKGSSLIPLPPLLEYYPSHWPALRGVSDWVMESDIHDPEMRQLYVEGKALQPHLRSSDHKAVIFRIDEYARSLPGLPWNLVVRHDDPDWMINVVQTFNTIWNEVTLRSLLRANEIALLKGGVMNQFRVHDALLPLVQESPYYCPPSMEEPMDQDETDPDINPIQHTAESSSLADRLDYGEGASFSRPPPMHVNYGQE